MRDKAQSRRIMHPVRKARDGEAVLPHSRAVGPQPQADGDPFTSVEARSERSSPSDRCYSIDSRGRRYYFHINLRHPVIVRGVKG
jgi:hypothetical protein